MNPDKRAEKHQPAPWLFLFGVLAWTWTCYGLVAFSGQSMQEFPAILLSALGGFGPSLTAVVLIAAGRWDRQLDQSPEAFFLRALDPRTLSLRWALITLGLVLVLAFLPVLLDPAVLRERGLIGQAPGFFLLIGVVIGTFEEIGWRGYAQEALQRRLPVLTSSLIIGLFWGAWHIPLFFISGSYQAGLGVATPGFWSFFIALLVGSPVYAWLYNRSGRVILAPILYHALGNFFRELAPDASNLAEVGVEAAIALAVVSLSWLWITRVKTPHTG